MEVKKIPINISEIKECPHCGSDLGYYQKVKYKGYFEDNRLFSTGEPYNTGMWDGAIETYRSKIYYCMECKNPICKSTSFSHP